MPTTPRQPKEREMCVGKIVNVFNDKATLQHQNGVLTEHLLSNLNVKKFTKDILYRIRYLTDGTAEVDVLKVRPKPAPGTDGDRVYASNSEQAIVNTLEKEAAVRAKRPKNK